MWLSTLAHTLLLLTGLITYISLCVLLGELKIGGQPKPSRHSSTHPASLKPSLKLPAVTWTSKNDIWHLISWDHNTVGPDSAWKCLLCACSCIYVNGRLDYISSPSISCWDYSGQISSKQHRNQITVLQCLPRMVANGAKWIHLMHVGVIWWYRKCGY